MLPVAVDRHEQLEVVLLGILKGREQGRSIAAISLVLGYTNVTAAGEQARRFIGRAVINDQDFAATVSPNFVQYAIDMLCFVIDGQGNEPTIGHNVSGCGQS